MEDLTKTGQGLEKSIYKPTSTEDLIRKSNNLNTGIEAVEYAKEAYNELTESPLLVEYSQRILKFLRRRGVKVKKNVGPIRLGFIPAYLDSDNPMKISGQNGDYVVTVNRHFAKSPYLKGFLMNELGHAIIDTYGGPSIDQHESLGLEPLLVIQSARVFEKYGYKELAEGLLKKCPYIRSFRKQPWD